MTLTNLYRKTLEKLQVAAAGESADADDTALVAAKYTSVYNMLVGLDLVMWPQTGPIPDECAEPVILALSFVTAVEFGWETGSFAEGALGLNPPSLAERQIRQQLAREYVSYPAVSEYY